MTWRMGRYPNACLSQETHQQPRGYVTWPCGLLWPRLSCWVRRQYAPELGGVDVATTILRPLG